MKKLLVAIALFTAVGMMNAADPKAYDAQYRQLVLDLKHANQIQNRMARVSKLVDWNKEAKLIVGYLQSPKQKKFLQNNIEKNKKFILEVGAPQQSLRPGLARELFPEN